MPSDLAKDVEKQIKKMDNVTTYTFLTKQQVKEQMQEESDVFKTVLENFDEESSPLKDTFQVKVKEIESIKGTAKKIEKLEHVAVVRYGEGMVDKMVTAFASIEKVTYGIGIEIGRASCRERV